MGLITSFFAKSKTETKPLENQSESTPSKGVFGALLEKAQGWVKPVGSAKIDATPLQRMPEWNNAKNLDLSDCKNLPRNFTTPKKLEKLRLNYDVIDQNWGQIHKDPGLLNGINQNGRSVKVEFVISTREIFGIMQNSPEKLTPEMANIIVGKREGVTGLSDRALFRALERLEAKFTPSQIKEINPEVKNILLNKLIDSTDQEVKEATKQLTEFLKGSEFAQQATDKTQSNLTAEQKNELAITQETQAIIKALGKLQRKVGDNPQDWNLQDLANKIFGNNKKLIQAQMRSPFNRLSVDNVKESLSNEVYEHITDSQLKKALISIALESLARLETMFERTQTDKAKKYERITQQNAGSKDKIIYATAQMDRASDYKVNKIDYKVSS
jgi:hypothetical protein